MEIHMQNTNTDNAMKARPLAQVMTYMERGDTAVITMDTIAIK